MDDINKKIKNIRQQKGLTLKDLSEKTGLSISFLSQVERGTSSLAVTSLKKISDALEVNIAYFFENYQSNHNYVVKSGNRSEFNIEGSKPTYARLNGEFTGRSLEPMLVKMAPKQERSQILRHPGEEFYYVLKGAALFYVNDKEYFIREGDTIHFPSNEPHCSENPLDEETILLSILTPVIF
ncbi:helix-turn-helix domain-containing protein [Scopulibacillus cellulosilyticus]|uniref:Helix-turn-helix domain-containing protein n=1 Tax=Scopulibacillus cellulosilyticus TaxID=2665665 RepID=A0ABW2PRS5_9BACL